MALLALFVLPDKIPCFVAHLGRQVRILSQSSSKQLALTHVSLQSPNIAAMGFSKFKKAVRAIRRSSGPTASRNTKCRHATNTKSASFAGSVRASTHNTSLTRVGAQIPGKVWKPTSAPEHPRRPRTIADRTTENLTGDLVVLPDFLIEAPVRLVLAGLKAVGKGLVNFVALFLS